MSFINKISDYFLIKFASLVAKIRTSKRTVNHPFLVETLIRYAMGIKRQLKRVVRLFKYLEFQKLENKDNFV